MDEINIAAQIAVNYPWPAADILPLVQLANGDEQKVRTLLDEGIRKVFGDADMPLRWVKAVLTDGRVSW